MSCTGAEGNTLESRDGKGRDRGCGDVLPKRERNHDESHRDRDRFVREMFRRMCLYRPIFEKNIVGGRNVYFSETG